MAQLFRPRATAVFRLAVALAALGAPVTGALAYLWARSPGAWNVGEPAPQPIAFSHALHSGALEVDCRYCHTSVERAAHAGMPSAETCLGCHSQVWVGAGALEPVRTSVALGQAIRWTSVHRLPDHVRFHHGAHVANGIGCGTCHGQVERMPETVRARTLSMGWCLDCHRDAAARLDGGSTAVAAGGGAAPGFDGSAHEWLTGCNTCHR